MPPARPSQDAAPLQLGSGDLPDARKPPLAKGPSPRNSLAMQWREGAAGEGPPGGARDSPTSAAPSSAAASTCSRGDAHSQSSASQHSGTHSPIADGLLQRLPSAFELPLGLCSDEAVVVAPQPQLPLPAQPPLQASSRSSSTKSLWRYWSGRRKDGEGRGEGLKVEA